MVKILWEIPWKGMRNALFYGQNAGNTMRNAVLKSISHNISIWLSFVYRKTMRIWEMQVKNRRQEKVCVVECQIRVFLYDID